MIDIENLKQYQTNRPARWSLFGDAEDFDKLPASHKEQIFFLDKTATDFLFKFLKQQSLLLIMIIHLAKTISKRLSTIQKWMTKLD